MNEESLKAFLIELTALSKKHGIAIDACGCCGSPWVRDRVVKDEHYVATIVKDDDLDTANCLELVSVGSELPGEVR